jgi:hypothetical protein
MAWPRPCRGRECVGSVRARNASRIVLRETQRRSASATSEGSRSPADKPGRFYDFADPLGSLDIEGRGSALSKMGSSEV